MTTQNNVVTPEINSCINNLISTTVLPSATTVPESMAMLGGFLNFSHNNNNLIKRLEGSKVNAWIDSMRAASPTRTINKSSENQEKCSWIVSIYIYIYYNNPFSWNITLFMIFIELFVVAALSSFSFEIV
jgi:trehalose 6-phosphate phosphatase